MRHIIEIVLQNPKNSPKMGKNPCFYPDKQGKQRLGFRERKPSRTPAPPFQKALCVGCLFCWVAFPSLVGVSILFLSVQVLERFIRATKKVRNGLFSLTANFAGSKNYFMRYLARKLSFKSCALKNRSLAGEHKTTILI